MKKEIDIHKTRQVALMAVIGIVFLLAVAGLIIKEVTRASDPYRAVAEAIEKRIAWVDVLDVYHDDFEEEHYLNVIVDIPMFKSAEELSVLHEVAYEEMLVMLDGSEDWLSVLFVTGDKDDDVYYRMELALYLKKEFIGRRFDTANWMPVFLDSALDSIYEKWPGR